MTLEKISTNLCIRSCLFTLAYFLVCTAVSLVPVLSASASTTGPTPVIYQVQTGASNAAGQEFISIYNNSDQVVDVTGWCLLYMSASGATTTILGCLVAPLGIHLKLNPFDSFAAGSQEFGQANPDVHLDIIFTSGISGTSGHIKLVNLSRAEVDKIGYGSAISAEGASASTPATGKILQRVRLSEGQLQDSDNNAADFTQTDAVYQPSNLYEEMVTIDLCANLPGVQESLPRYHLQNTAGDCVEDMCANIDGLQLIIPDRFVAEGDHLCTQLPLESRVLFISELLPDPSGADGGKEFIELYNPHDQPVNIKDYHLQLGPSFAKSYSLPDITIPSASYYALTDTQTGITLNNTTASVRLVAPSGDVVSTAQAYNQLGEDVSWAYFNNAWLPSFQPTPGAPNVIILLKPCSEGMTRNSETGYCKNLEEEVEQPLVACLPGQERNPTTGRCRKAAILSSVACKVNQVRNEETGRCRNLAPANQAQVACKATQARNPDTGRCKNTTLEGPSKTCPTGQVRAAETNRCRKAVPSVAVPAVQDVRAALVKNNAKWWAAGIASTGSVSYAAYEWRQDFAKHLAAIRARLRRQ